MIYTSLVRPKSCFYVRTCKRQQSVIVLMITVSITNIYVKVFPPPKIIATRELYPRSLTKPGNKIQRPFDLTYIDYNQIKYQIVRMELVEYNTAIGRNSMNEYYL